MSSLQRLLQDRTAATQPCSDCDQRSEHGGGSQHGVRVRLLLFLQSVGVCRALLFVFVLLCVGVGVRPLQSGRVCSFSYSSFCGAVRVRLSAAVLVLGVLGLDRKSVV